MFAPFKRLYQTSVLRNTINEFLNLFRTFLFSITRGHFKLFLGLKTLASLLLLVFQILKRFFTYCQRFSVVFQKIARSSADNFRIVFIA